jgi:hypothetical protein
LRHWIFIIIICSLVTSCGNKPQLIPKKKLIEMMVDLNIYDALSLDSYVVSQLGDLDSADIYSSFFVKYKYTKEDLDYTLEYYANKPKKLIEIYDAVFAELSKKSDELKALEKKFSYSGLQNIWNHKPNDTTSLNLSKQANTYDIKIDSAGTYVITAQIKMTTDDQSINPRITAYYYNPQNKDTTLRHYFKNTTIIKSPYFREYQVYEKNDNEQLNHLHIVIPDRDNKDTLFIKSFDLGSFSVGIMRNDPEKNTN